MTIRRVSAGEARELLERSGYVYIDVRTEAEYAAGHPVGAYNLPSMVSTSAGMVPNESFVAELGALFARDARLVLGCRSGQRSLRAAALLEAAGWGDLVDLRPGYAGARDAFGRVREAGWEAEGCPCEQSSPGRSYAELKARIG